MSKRLPEFDIAKAIALFGVIVGHSQYLGVPAHVARFFYSFDMPLFFIISGFFQKTTDKLDAKFIKKNAMTLLAPYVVTCSIVILGAALQAAANPNQSIADVTFYWTKASFFGAGSITPKTPSFVPQIGAVWYLLALFFAKCYLAYANQQNNPLVLVLVAFFVGCSTTELFWLPFSIQSALGAVLFLYIGQRIRQSNTLKKLTNTEWFLVAVVWLFSSLKYGELYMVTNTYIHGMLDVIGGVFGALTILKISEIVAATNSRFAGALSIVGSHTLPLFCMHLVELNLFQYETIAPAIEMTPLPQWISYIIARLIVIALLSAVLYLTPSYISGLYYPSKRKRS